MELNVLCLNRINPFNSPELWFKQNSYGASSISFISSFVLLMMMVRLPQANREAKKAAISMSCFRVKRCGTETGSLAINEGRLYSSTFLSKKSFSFWFTVQNYANRKLPIEAGTVKRQKRPFKKTVVVMMVIGLKQGLGCL